jgi:hypothetical protein
MSVGLLFYMFDSTKISEFSDIRKYLNTFMYQALAFLASKNAAEIRFLKGDLKRFLPYYIISANINPKLYF